jgi:hypothetical protein
MKEENIIILGKFISVISMFTSLAFVSKHLPIENLGIVFVLSTIVSCAILI